MMQCVVAKETSCLVINNYYALPVKTKFGGQYVRETPVFQHGANVARYSTQCSAGARCSNTCRFLSYGTQCRAAIGECDIVEYCLGDSGECPADDHQRNGILCNNGTGYCYGGMCPTHDAQCQVAFGKSMIVLSAVTAGILANIVILARF